MIPPIKSESGQIIYLIAITIIGFLAVTALAVDGGRLYAERRQIQGVADASAYAGALIIAKDIITGDPMDITTQIESDAHTASDARAISNDYDDDNENVSVISSISGPYTDEGVYYLFEVEVQSTIETIIAQIAFSGALANTVEAVVRARPTQSLFYGNSVVSTSMHECESMWFSGSADLVVTGGDIFSNSDANSPNCKSGKKGGSGNVIVDGGIALVGGWNQIGPGIVDPPPTTGAIQITISDPPTPDCSGLTDRGSFSFPSGTETLEPGVYGDLNIGSADVTLLPGMYCFNGGDGINTLSGSLFGNDVFIVINSGNFETSGNTAVNLFAATDLVDASGNQWGGFLIYMPYDNDGFLHISGASDSHYRGTIYAPGPTSSNNAKCTVEGAGAGLLMESQIICYTVRFTGAANIEIIHVKEQNYYLPAAIFLQE